MLTLTKIFDILIHVDAKKVDINMSNRKSKKNTKKY